MVVRLRRIPWSAFVVNYSMKATPLLKTQISFITHISCLQRFDKPKARATTQLEGAQSTAILHSQSAPSFSIPLHPTPITGLVILLSYN